MRNCRNASRSTGFILNVVLFALQVRQTVQQEKPPKPPIFPESYVADIESRRVQFDAKGVQTGEIIEASVYYDRKRSAERIDVHTYQTSYLFLYGRAQAYMTMEGRCFTAVLPKPMLSTRLPTSAQYQGIENNINEEDGVEHWESQVPVYGTKEEVWIKRIGKDCWPVRDKFYRDDHKDKLEVVTNYLGFEPGRQDPEIFKAPTGDVRCIPFPGDQFDLALLHRNTLHFNPVHIPNIKPIEAVPRDNYQQGRKANVKSDPSIDPSKDDGSGPNYLYEL